jgi:Transposase DDE domain
MDVPSWSSPAPLAPGSRMILPPAPTVPPQTPKPRRIGAKPGSRIPTRPRLPLIAEPPRQATSSFSLFPPELAAALKVLPPEVPPEVLAGMVLPRVPLANAVLTAWAYLLRPAVLDDFFEKHRGRCYLDTLRFSTFVDLIRDALVLHQGSGRQSFQRALREGTLPTCPEAVYGKLRRIPLRLSMAFLEEITELIRGLRPQDIPAEALPESLAGLTITVLDGKQIKEVAKRLKPVRGRPGKVVGGKILVAYLPAEGLAVTMAADPDGEANDIRLMPAAVPRARARIAGVRLWVADRQFCDLNQPARLTEQGDHFLLRRPLKLGFHADPDRPARPSVDAQGRTVIEQWGGIGSPKEKRRRYVRQIHLIRPGEEDLFLVTDLLDEHAYPAGDLLWVYLQRWQVERVFQQITEVFALRRLLGSTPEATVFQAAFCLVMYNLMQVVRAFVAVSQAAVATVDSVSVEQLFGDVQRELTAVTVLFPSATLAGWFTAEWSPEAVRERLRALLGGVWTPLYLKAVNKKPRPKVKKAKGSGAHTSVHKVLEAERKKRRQDGKDP